MQPHLQSCTTSTACWHTTPAGLSTFAPAKSITLAVAPCHAWIQLLSSLQSEASCCTSLKHDLASAKRLQELAQTLHVHCRVVDGYALGDCVPMTTNKPYAQVGYTGGSCTLITPVSAWQVSYLAYQLQVSNTSSELC